MPASNIDEQQFQNTGPDWLTAIGALVRGIDIPRQLMLQHAMGGQYGDALGQVMDPSKVLTGQSVVQKQLPGLINSSPAGAAALGTALEFADPLVAFGAAKPALSAAIGLGDVGAVGRNIKPLYGSALEGAETMLTPRLAQYKSLEDVPLETAYSGIRGWVLPNGKVLASAGGMMHEDMAQAAGHEYLDLVEKGGVRYDIGRGGSTAIEFDARQPDAVRRAKELLDELGSKSDHVVMDAWVARGGVKSFQGDPKEAKRFLSNIRSFVEGPTVSQTLEEGIAQAFEEGKKAQRFH